MKLRNKKIKCTWILKKGFAFKSFKWVSKGELFISERVRFAVPLLV